MIIERIIPDKEIHFPELEGIDEVINKITQNYCNTRDKVQYEMLYRYCTTKLKYKGKIENFIKYLKKQNIQRKITTDWFTGYEYCIYGVNGKAALQCKHYFKADMNGVEEHHSITIIN